MLVSSLPLLASHPLGIWEIHLIWGHLKTDSCSGHFYKTLRPPSSHWENITAITVNPLLVGVVFVLHKMCELPKLWRVWETAEPPVIELPPDFFFLCFASPPIICHTCSQYSYIFTDLSGRRPQCIAMVPFSEQKGEIGNKLLNCSGCILDISTYLSGYRSFWAMRQVA